MKCIHVLLLLGVGFVATLALLGQTGTNPVPMINEPVNPAAIAPGGAAFTLTVNGTGFVSGAVVNWNGTAQTTTFVSSSQITASIAASNIASPGTASITVVNPTPGGGESNVVYLPIATAAGGVAVSQSNVFQSGGAPRQAVGDFNGDGKLDLAVTDSAGVQVLLGNGDGTFQAAAFYPVSGGTFFVIVGDFNGDGKLDIATQAGSDMHLRSAAILLGNGDGTFQAPIYSSLDTSLSCAGWLAPGDFNGDGKLDLAVGYGCGSSAISVLLGNGDGTFQPFVDYATASEPVAVAVGDFNGDGKLDLATANFGNFAGRTVSVLLGTGDGTFQPHVEYQADGGSQDLVVADFNGDGKLDLAVDCACGHSSTCGRPGTVAVLIGNGDGTFKAPSIYDADEYPFSIATADLTGDGKLDLAVTDFDSAKISLLFGNGDGTFRPHFDVPLLNSLLGLQGGPVGITTGDFNGDGLLDLATDGRDYLTGVDNVRLLLQTQAVAVLSSTSLNFGGQDVGSTSAVQNVTLNNFGRAPLVVSSISMNGTNGSDFAANTGTCLSGVAAGANCTLSFTFAPHASGLRNGLLTITDNAGDSPQAVSLSGTGEDFGIAVASGTSSSATVTAGATATYTVTVSPQGGSTQTVSLACTGAPAYSKCTPSSPSVTLDGTNSQNVTFTVTTTKRGMLRPPMRPPDSRRIPPVPVLIWLVGFIFMAYVGMIRRLRPQVRFALLVLGIITLASLAGCGGGGYSGSSGGGTGSSGTPAGNYTLTITGSSGNVSHSTTVTLMVQ